MALLPFFVYGASEALKILISRGHKSTGAQSLCPEAISGEGLLSAPCGLLQGYSAELMSF